MQRITISALVGCLGILNVQPAPARASCPLRFLDVASAKGVDFRHDNGARGAKHLPETMGAGVAWIDFDGDGWEDLYLVQSGPFPPDGSDAAGDRLFRNRGVDAEGAIGFEEWTARVGGDRGHYGQGVLSADLDGDGDLDLALGGYGGDALLLNQGDGSLTRRDEPTVGERPWTSSLAAADLDADGDLDLYQTRYLDYAPDHGLFCGERVGADGAAQAVLEYCDPSLFEGQEDRVLVNDGAAGFADRSERWGVGRPGGDPPGKGLGVLLVDLDGDGRPDAYVANDITLNRLLRNVAGTTFEDVSLLTGVAVNGEGRPEAGMGLGLGDDDGDGLAELFVSNFDVETNTLYRNRSEQMGALFYEDVATASGFGLPSFNRLGFGLVVQDFDLDGRLDVYVANGHIFERPNRQNVSYRQRDLVLRGLEGARYQEVACAVEGIEERVGRGLAAADWDRDGDVDLAINNNDDAAQLLENRSAIGNWLQVELVGRAPNTQAIGAVVTLRAGASLQRRWVVAGGSYQSSSSRVVGFATPPEGGALLEVRWPDGQRMRVGVDVARRRLRVVEPFSRSR